MLPACASFAALPVIRDPTFRHNASYLTVRDGGLLGAPVAEVPRYDRTSADVMGPDCSLTSAVVHRAGGATAT
ncbi:hypothetical protein JCM9957A_58390 [Kineosporia succinea]